VEVEKRYGALYMTEVYIISYSGWEEYGPVVMKGPTDIDIKEYCKALLPKAAQKALLEANQVYQKHGYAPYVQAPEIRDALVEILQELGFVKLAPKSFNLWEGSFWTGCSGENRVELFGQEIADQMVELENRPDRENE